MKKIHSNFHQILPVRKFRDYLAAERTDLALETTQLAWIRTTLAMIAIGTVINKGSDALYKAKVIEEEITVQSDILGIILAMAGTVLLTVITFYFLIRRRQLSQLREGNPYAIIPVLLISVFTILAGVGLSYLLIIS
ncbi:YidH family protein [Flavobacterium hauense]